VRIAWHMPTFQRSCCGLSNRALRIAEGLRDFGHAITFLVAEHKTDTTSNAIGADGVQLLSTPNLKPVHWSLQSRTRRRIADTVVREVDSEHDVMLSCQPEFIIAYAEHHPLRPLVFICGGTTLLHDEADHHSENDRPWYRRWPYAVDRYLKHHNETLAFRAAHAVVFDSDATRERVIREYGIESELCHTIHGGVDPNEFIPPSTAECRIARAQLGICESAFVLVWTGRISPEKHLDLLLHALIKCRRMPDRVLLVGDGPMRVAISDLRDRLGLGGVVSMMGKQADVRPFLRSADAFVFPSRGESFGGSLVEAMACGLPSIALRPDGDIVRNANLEIIDHEVTGLLVDPAEPAAFASAIDRLMNDRSLRLTLAQAARHRAESCFTWTNAAAQLNALLENLGTREARGRPTPAQVRTVVAFGRP
jgi:glycosyltransferase involved in cell wall biosynthesis